MSGPTVPTDVLRRRRAVRLPRRRRARRAHRRPADPRVHRHADEHAAVGRAPRRRGLHRPLPAAARPRHPLAGLQRQHPRPVDDGGRRGLRRPAPPSCDRVFVAGLSMGGTLATRLAEVRPDDVAGLLLVNPALLTQRLDAKLLPLIAKLTGSWAPIASDIKKPGVTELAYPKLPTRAMMQLRTLWAATRADLARVTAPVIVFHSAEDHVVEPINTQGAAGRHLQHRHDRGRAARQLPRGHPRQRRAGDLRGLGRLDPGARARRSRRRRAPRRRRRDRAPGTTGQRAGRRRSGARCATSTRGSASTCSTCCTPSASPPTWSRRPTSSRTRAR